MIPLFLLLIIQSANADSFRDFGNADTTIVSLEQPLWTGGRLKGGLDRATADLQETEEGFGQLQRELVLNVVRAYGNWLAADLKVKSWLKTLDTGDVITLTAATEGTVQDVAGNAMVSTRLPVGNNIADNKAIVIDTTPPEFTATALFGAEEVISTTQGTAFSGTWSVTTADINGDGYLDVVSASGGDDTVVWFKNDGSGNFGAKQVINNAQDGVHSVTTADIDGDGDVDVVSASSNDNTVTWFKNDGSGGFGAEQVISSAQLGARSVTTADIDGDGDLDVLTASASDNTVAWFKNDGSGNFGAARVISETQDGAYSVTTADIDGDGNLDVVSASWLDNTVAWFKNDGSGNFSDARVISNTQLGARSVTTADIDGDGDLDVVSASWLDNTVAWFKNDGAGNFGDARVISETHDLAWSVTTADVDGDGDVDVLSTSLGDGTVAWFKNDGSGNFGTEQVISNIQGSIPVSVTTADIDGDGDVDVVSASSGSDTVGVFRNLSLNVTDNTGAAQVIYTAAADNTTTEAVVLNVTNAIEGAPTVTATLNDGYMPSYTAVAANTSNMTEGPVSTPTFDLTIDTTPPAFTATALFGAEEVISTTQGTAFSGTWSVTTADIDGDGNLDVVSASGGDDTVVWFKNDGSGNFGAKQVINNAQDGVHSVTTADIDGDGDVDVVSASSNDNTVAWFKNDGSGNFGAEQVISSAQLVARSVTTADIDGDGDLDVLSASASDDTVAWFENDGSGNFGDARVISETQDGAYSVTTADIDGDGDLDVLSASGLDDTVAWFKNDGSGNFGAEQVISNTQDGARSVTTADIDGDGDLDVVSASWLDNTVAWFKNDGAGNFGDARVISETQDITWSVTTADVDGDGDLDVLSAAVSDDTVAWFENDGSGNFGAARVISNQDGAVSVTTADIDGDGDVDVLSVAVYDGTISVFRNLNLNVTENTGAGQVIYTAAAGNTTSKAVALIVTNAIEAPPTVTATITNSIAGEGFFTVLYDGDTTNDTSPGLEGTINTSLSGSEVVRIYDGATLLGTATVSVTHWSYQDSRTLNDGDTPSYTAVVVNTSDMTEGPVSTPTFDLIITTTVTVAPIALDGVEYSTEGVLLDVDGDGDKEQTQAWVAADDGLLVYIRRQFVYNLFFH